MIAATSEAERIDGDMNGSGNNSGKEDLFDRRFAAARSVVLGGPPLKRLRFKADRPKKCKPQIEHLKVSAEERNPACPKFRKA